MGWFQAPEARAFAISNCIVLAQIMTVSCAGRGLLVRVFSQVFSCSHGLFLCSLLVIPRCAGYVFMQSKSENCRWLLRPDVVSTVLNDGAVILDLRTKFFFSLNVSGWAIAQMFESGASRSEVLAASLKWGAGSADHPGINGLIDQLIAEQLVEPANNSVPAGGEVTLTAWTPPMLSKHREPLQRIMVSAFDPGLPLAE